MPNAKVLSEKQAIVAELVERLKGASAGSADCADPAPTKEPAPSVDAWLREAKAQREAGRIDNKSQFVVILSDWVGYGDEIDYRKFTVRNNVAASFLVYGSDAMKFEIYRLVGKTDKKGVTTYSLKTLQSTTVKKPKGGSQYLAYTTPLKLEAGTYYFSVKSTNAKKGGSSDYSVAINSMEAYASAADALAMPETDALADSLAMPDGLSFGQYDTDVLAGSYLDSASNKLFGESGAGLLASL